MLHSIFFEYFLKSKFGFKHLDLFAQSTKNFYLKTILVSLPIYWPICNIDIEINYNLDTIIIKNFKIDNYNAQKKHRFTKS